jgi:hypothetical protein
MPTLLERHNRAILRLDILIEGARRSIEDLKDVPDLKRHKCKTDGCDTMTRCSKCANCFVEQLRRDHL